VSLARYRSGDYFLNELYDVVVRYVSDGVADRRLDVFLLDDLMNVAVSVVHLLVWWRRFDVGRLGQGAPIWPPRRDVRARSSVLVDLI